MNSSSTVLQRATSPANEVAESKIPDEGTVEDLPDEAICPEMSPASNSKRYVRSKNISSRITQELAPLRENSYCLPSPLDDKTCVLLNDALKIVFNQTLDWADKDCEGVSA